MTPAMITCRYLGRDSNRCTGEAVDELGEILLCPRHLALAVELLRANNVTVQVDYLAAFNRLETAA